MNRRALFAGTLGTAIAATVGRAEAASPAPEIDGVSLLWQLEEYAREEFRARARPREMRVLMNENTNEALGGHVLDRETTPYQRDALMFQWGTMRIVLCPDIVDGVALVQFGNDPFFEIHG